MTSTRKPDWIKSRIGGGPEFKRLDSILRDKKLHTVCEEAMCPNRGKCWEKGRATLMILGDICTRGCSFCNVTPGKPPACDNDEPRRVADAVKAMGIKDIVITSVTRDDLKDGGAAIWAETIRRVYEAVPGIFIETLIPDFGGSKDALKTVMDAEPGILGHNLETVPSLYTTVRPKANYRQSLELLNRAHKYSMVTKSGIMVGLGETSDEMLSVMKDLIEAACDILYIGQYLQPTKKNLPVSRYVEPSEFESYKSKGLEMGFKVVVSGPLVRSSYHSEEQAEFIKSLSAHL